jgi:hypothetical protein
MCFAASFIKNFFFPFIPYLFYGTIQIVVLCLMLIFIIFFGQLKDSVGQVLFLVSCPKGQVEKYVNVEAWLYKCLLDFILISSFLILSPFCVSFQLSDLNIK